MKFQGKKILFLTISRSGHHAIINWLMHQCKGTVYYHNNCMNGWENGELKTRLENNVVTHKNTDDDIETTIYTIEEFEMSDYEKYGFNDFDIDLTIIVNRDFKNWISSSIKGEGEGKENLIKDHQTCRGENKKGNIFMWEGLVRESLGLTNYVDNKYHINYNEWFSDANYRKEITDTLELDFNDEKINEVSTYGGGSSFSKLDIKNARNLGVLNRYKEMEQHKTYKKCMMHKEIIALDSKYFKQ